MDVKVKVKVNARANVRAMVNVNVRAPRNDEPKTFIISFFSITSLSPRIFFVINEIDQKRKTIVNALDVTDIIFTVNAICSTSKAKMEKIAPSI